MPQFLLAPPTKTHETQQHTKVQAKVRLREASMRGKCQGWEGPVGEHSSSTSTINYKILEGSIWFYQFYCHYQIKIESICLQQQLSQTNGITKQLQLEALEPTNHHYCVPWWRSVAVTAPQPASSGWTWTWEGSILICKIFFKSKNWALRQCSHVGEVVAEYAPVLGSRG